MSRDLQGQTECPEPRTHTSRDIRGQAGCPELTTHTSRDIRGQAGFTEPTTPTPRNLKGQAGCPEPRTHITGPPRTGWLFRAKDTHHGTSKDRLAVPSQGNTSRDLQGQAGCSEPRKHIMGPPRTGWQSLSRTKGKKATSPPRADRLSLFGNQTLAHWIHSPAR